MQSPICLDNRRRRSSRSRSISHPCGHPWFGESRGGELGWTKVDLVNVGDTNAPVLRAMLELFGIEVRYILAGQPRKIVHALGGDLSLAPYVVIAGHGTEAGIMLDDDLPAPIATNQPFRSPLTPELVRRCVHLSGGAVIFTGCSGGEPALAEAFLEAGADAYVADTLAPFSYASTFAPAMLFYDLTSGRSLDEAVAALQQHDNELSTWRIYRH